MISDDPLPHQPPPPALWREPLEPHSKPRPPEGGLPTMLGRKPHHAALGTPMLGKVHPCYLGNPHSLGGPGTTQRGRSPRMLQRELRDLEGGFHLSMGWRRPPSYFGNPEPQRGSPSFPALGGGGGPCTLEEAPPSGGGPHPQHREESPPQYFGNSLHQKMAASPHARERALLPPTAPPLPHLPLYFGNPAFWRGSSPLPQQRGFTFKDRKNLNVFEC